MTGTGRPGKAAPPRGGEDHAAGRGGAASAPQPSIRTPVSSTSSRQRATSARWKAPNSAAAR